MHSCSAAGIPVCHKDPIAVHPIVRTWLPVTNLARSVHDDVGDHVKWFLVVIIVHHLAAPGVDGNELVVKLLVRLIIVNVVVSADIAVSVLQAVNNTVCVPHGDDIVEDPFHHAFAVLAALRIAMEAQHRHRTKGTRMYKDLEQKWLR